MKRIKKYLSIFLSLLFFIVFINNGFIVKATTPEPNTFSVQNVNLSGINLNCYVYSNSSLLPDTKQFYWVQNGYVQHALYSDALVVMINKKFGIAIKPNYLTGLISYIETNIWSNYSILRSFFSDCAGFVYNGSAVVGVALDDLSGFSLSGDNNYTSFSIPSTVVNNTWNTWNTYIQENPSTTPFFNVEPEKPYYFDCSPELSEDYQTNSFNIVNGLGNDDILFLVQDVQVTTGNVTSTYNKFMTPISNFGDRTCNVFSNISNKVIVHANSPSYDTSWSTFCTNFNLNENKTTLTASMLRDSSTNFRLQFYNAGTLEYNAECKSYNALTGTSNNTTEIPSLTHYGSYPVGKKSFTVYESLNSLQSITNNTYQKNYYTSTTTNNYHTTNNNTTVINKRDMNDPQSTNQTVYNQSSTTTNNNTTENNYYYDQSENDNSVTTIINNYYGDSSGGDSGGNDDDDDDDSIWDALLKALSGFLKKIGELLATILTGIIEICTDVLGAIASITESFSGITDFIGTIFGFIPSEIISVLTLGITLAVLISLIRLFRK